jgi:hypothetical protein
MTTPAHPGTQLGRSALLVHGLMWLAVGVCAALVFALKPTDETLTCAGVAMAAVLVFCVWSIVLSIRAIRMKEKLFCPAAVLVANSLAVGFYFALIAFLRNESSLNQWAVCNGLPVIVPVLVFFSVLAAPVAIWRVRRAERLEVASGAPAWTPGGKWKRGLMWFAPLVVLLSALTLPAPLFVYSIRMSGRYSTRDSSLLMNVQKHTPEFIADGVAGYYSGSTTSRDIETYCLAVSTGRVSKSRLVSELKSTNQFIQSQALYGLFQRDKLEALKWAEELGVQSLAAPSAAQLEFMAGSLIGRDGTVEQIQRMLALAERATKKSSFLETLIRVQGWSDKKCSAELERLVATQSPYRGDALFALAYGANQRELERIWLAGLNDPVPTRVDELTDALSEMHSGVARDRIVRAALNHSQPHVRASVLRFLAANPTFLFEYTSDGEFREILIERLDDADLQVRRAALPVVASMIGATPRIRPPTGSPETELETDERADVKAAAAKFLKDTK